jgi:hypothetical protein
MSLISAIGQSPVEAQRMLVFLWPRPNHARGATAHHTHAPLLNGSMLSDGRVIGGERFSRDSAILGGGSPTVTKHSADWNWPHQKTAFRNKTEFHCLEGGIATMLTRSGSQFCNTPPLTACGVLKMTRHGTPGREEHLQEVLFFEALRRCQCPVIMHQKARIKVA